VGPLAASVQFDSIKTLEFKRKRGMDSNFEEKNWTGSTGWCG
jgi:hypothetical protein